MTGILFARVQKLTAKQSGQQKGIHGQGDNLNAKKIDLISRTDKYCYPNYMKTLIGLAMVLLELGRHTGYKSDWGFGGDPCYRIRVFG